MADPPVAPPAWWCHTHANVTTNPAGCGVVGHCRLVGPYPGPRAAAAWEGGEYRG